MNATKEFLLNFEFKFLPEHWELVTRVRIIDADGWPEDENFMKTWDVPITRDDFFNRAARSTADYPRDFLVRAGRNWW